MVSRSKQTKWRDVLYTYSRDNDNILWATIILFSCNQPYVYGCMVGCMIEEHIVALVGLVQTIISKNIAKYFVR